MVLLYRFIVTEHVEGGELFDYLVKRGFLEPQEALQFFQQIVNGLECCHHHLICHRDLKPENILLDADRRIKIADFGMATQMRAGSLLETSCGSPHYASPEVIMGVKYDGRAADVWSCGVILYALLSGKLPFDDDNIRRLLDKVKAGSFSLPAYLHRDVKDLISRMLTVDPAKRITIPEIREHPWFNSQKLSPPVPLTPLDEYAADPVPEADQDTELMRNLRALGWGHTLEELSEALSSPQRNHVKVFYRLLEHRKRVEGRLFDPETPPIKRSPNPTRTGRSMSAATRSEAHAEVPAHHHHHRHGHAQGLRTSAEKALKAPTDGSHSPASSSPRNTTRLDKERIPHALREDRRRSYAVAGSSSPATRSTGLIDAKECPRKPEKMPSTPQRKANVPPLERRKSAGDSVMLIKRTEVHSESNSSASLPVRPSAST